MRLANWVEGVGSWPTLKRALDSEAGLSIESICGEARVPLVAAFLVAQPQRDALIVTPSYERALNWQARLALCGIDPDCIHALPSGISSLFEDSPPEVNALSDRMAALRALLSSERSLVIATPTAALERTLPADVLRDSLRTLRVGDSAAPAEIVKSLSRLGYEFGDPVRIVGQFSLRGGILDIYPAGCEAPVRLDFFGDSIESMREFDPGTQRSSRAVPDICLSPVRETVFVHEEFSTDWSEILMRAVDQESGALEDEAAERLRDLVSADAVALNARTFFDRLDLYRPFLHPDSGCAVDLLNDDALIVLDDPHELQIFAERNREELSDALNSRHRSGEMLHSVAGDFLVEVERLGHVRHVLALSDAAPTPDWVEASDLFRAEARSLSAHRGRAETLGPSLKNWLHDEFAVTIATDQPTRSRAMLAQIDVFPDEPKVSSALFEVGAHLVNGNLAGGFVDPSAKFALVTDHELFGVGRLKLPQKRFSEGAPISTVLDLKPGDYVVHIHFGIGIFRGLTNRSVEGVEKEFLFIEYQAPDRLYVPADQLDRIQKYLNPGDEKPKLYRLTGGDWKKTVERAREDARVFARQLIKLYAQRKAVARPAYGPDTPWQAEMEATFPWVETPAQIQAIRETKSDLNQPFPMDRLVCGDVGFGKTEVAIRAAFKVAQAGRQVAMLCPTTILSEQHFRNFTERLAPFPLKVDILNRFRSTAERKAILRSLKDGSLDILIGTHALLSKEIEFKDLGMVIVDEEQKFGVKHKEALKDLRISVDVLTLSATPIPRTLSMALMDIRQMSLINDPPPGRLPVRTFVRPYSSDMVRDAILRELARGGQVYYVYNRVEGIYHVAEKLRKLVPHARLAVGHGQMSEKELEPVMIGFIKGEIDVLLSTTIIENGLDIPNANTLIVENADHLGLAQLYQLRGRVGRSDRQAYAYFVYQSHKQLTENAESRMDALQEFSTLGSGYSLAFRDLQIRGAGELLGAKQHGAMAAVGYELFTQIINEEVAYLKAHADGGDRPHYNDPLEGLTPLPAADLPVTALIPDRYISDQAQRLYYYKQMMSARSIDELRDANDEIADRYGPLPKPTENAFAVMRIRLNARDRFIDKIDGAGGRLSIHFHEDADLSPRIFSLMGKRNRECYLTRDKLVWPYSGDPIVACNAMLETLTACVDEVERQRAMLEA